MQDFLIFIYFFRLNPDILARLQIDPNQFKYKYKYHKSNYKYYGQVMVSLNKHVL